MLFTLTIDIQDVDENNLGEAVNRFLLAAREATEADGLTYYLNGVRTFIKLEPTKE